MAIIIHIPNLGSSTIPNQVRIALGIILAMILVPVIPMPVSQEALGIFPFSMSILKEIIIGTFIGFAAVLTFAAISVAGETMGLGSGFGSNQIFNPTIEQAATPLGQFFVIIAMLYFMTLNGHHVAIVALQKSFSILPVDSILPAFSFEILLRTTAQMILLGVQMAFPIFAALLMADITLALLSRVAPQVQFYFLGLPMKIGLSLIALGISIGIFFPFLRDLFNNLGEKMLIMIAN